MKKEKKDIQSNESRRRFLKNAGKVAVTAPAAAILLNTKAQALPPIDRYGDGDTPA
jgi:hypothetical protein